MRKEEVVYYLGYECEVKTITDKSLYGVVTLQNNFLVLSEKIMIPLVEVKEIYLLKS